MRGTSGGRYMSTWACWMIVEVMQLPMQIHLACAVACADSDIGEGRATAVRFGMSAICFALRVLTDLAAR